MRSSAGYYSLLALIWLNPQAAPAEDITCPKGTTLHGETTPDVREAWCELRWHGKTVQHGPYRAWWLNGTLGTLGQYVYGKAEGKWRGWYQTGQLQGEEWFSEGNKVKSLYYDRKGHVVAEPERSE
jgi:hypothetical protein